MSGRGKEGYCNSYLLLPDHTMSGKFGLLKLREVGGYVAKNYKFTLIPQYVAGAFRAYRSKYVNASNAGIRPFFHFVGVCIFINYLIEYNWMLKYEKNRKYH